MEIINEAAEKFKDKQGELCGMLFDMLRRINALEREMYARMEQIKKQKEERGIPSYQAQPEEKELWRELRQRMGEIVKPCCTDKLLKRGCGGTFSAPPKYSFIEGECKAHFIMKTARKAVVEMYFSQYMFQQEKFVLKSVEDKWLVDEVYYGIDSKPDKWYPDSIR